MKIVYTILLGMVCQISVGQDLWSAMNGPYGGNVRDIERAASGTLYAATDFGGYSSLDNGVTWNRISGITNFDVQDFEINPTTGRIYAVASGSSSNYFFSDDGTNWSSSSIAGVFSATKIRVHPTNAQIIFILSNNFLFRSPDGGVTWPQVTFVFPSTLRNIAINSSGVVVVGCDNNSLFRSVLGGGITSWGASQVTVDGSVTKTVRSLATFNDKFYALTIDNNLYKSDNGSTNTWTTIVTGSPSFTDTGLLQTGAINFNSTGKLYLAVDNAFWICDDPTIATPVWSRKGDVSCWGLTKIIAGANNDIFVTGSTHSVVKSTDLGVTWGQSISGITSIAPHDMLETTDGRILVADEVGFYVSLDQGQTWNTNKNPPNASLEYFRKLVELDDASILMLSGYGARKYEGSDVLTVGGATPEWMPYFTFSKTTTPGNNIIIGASSGQNIYRSIDNAATWTLESYTGLPGSFFVQQVEVENQTKYGDQGYLFIRLNDGANRLYRVKQGTTTAEILNLPAGTLQDIKILDAKDKDIIYALFQNGSTYTISYSKDHGDNWTSVTSPILTSSNSRTLSVLTDNTVEYKNENMLSVFADGGKIYISYDNGVNWAVETHSAPRALFKRIITTSQNHGYMIGQGVRARKSTRPLFIPRSPVNFRVKSFTFSRATFQWADSSSLEQVYVLEKSVGNNLNYQVETEGVTNSTTIQLTNLLPNTNYFFRLYAKGPGGNSPKTTEVNFTTLDNSCALSIPQNRSWTSIVQRARGPQFASLSPSTHINPDQQYSLTFDATGTELVGAAKVYAHAGVVLANSENPVTADPLAPWQNVIGNWGADDGIGQMTNVGGNQWELTLGPTLRNYFGVAGGTPIYWLGLVFRNADGSLAATNMGVSQDMFISIEKGYIDNTVGIDVSDANTHRYQIATSPNEFFEACGVISTLFPGTGSWNDLANTINFKWEDEESAEYTTYWENLSSLNLIDPAPSQPPTLEIYPFSAKKNYLTWNKVDYTTKYRIQRGEGALGCPSDIGGTGISYVSTNMYFSTNPPDPGPISGTVDIVPTGPGASTYTISDYSFGWYDRAGYTAGPPAIANFLLTHDCQFLSAQGGSLGESSWIYTIISKTATVLTFDWYSENGFDGGTTVLTRSDGKSWLSQLSQDLSIPVVAEIDYPNQSYFDEDPVLQDGITYTYRIAAVNDAGSTVYSKRVIITNSNPLFVPMVNELNTVTYSGQGISAVDLDNDGDDDVIMATFTNQFRDFETPKIFKNNGDGSFTEIVIPGMEIENNAVYRGCFAADFNNDEFPDLLFTRTNADVDNSVLKDILLLNHGSFNFTKTKIATRPGYANQFAASTALDFNGDGQLDMFTVGNGGPGGLSPHPSFLWKNNGAATFTEIKTAGTLTTDIIVGVETSTADYDNDGDLDLLVLDRSSNVAVRLYKNNGDETFSRANGLEFDVYKSHRWRTSSWGDIDNDGDLDLFVASQLAGSARHLYKNNGDGTFTNQISSVVTENDVSCFGSAFGDLDNDGDLDLIVISLVPKGNKIFFNNGDGTFVKSNSNEAINAASQSNIGIALADFNNDGFLDLLPPPNLGLPLTIFENQAKGVSTNKWIKFKLNGTTSNKSAIGARIKVTTGSINQIREISGRTGYGSQNSLTAHFGLGNSTVVNQVVITWPSGNVMTLNNLAVNQLQEITEDLAGPILATLSPANGATAVALDAKLEITFDEIPAGVNGKKIRVYKNPDLVTPVFTIDASAGVVSTNTISFTLPSNLDLFTQYTVTIEAGSITDSYQNVSTTISTAWSFTTIDNVPPSISFVQIPLLDKGFASITLTATVTDNAGVASVTLTHRGVTSKTFNAITGVKNGDTWEFTVAESLFDAMGLQYYFTARDLVNNESRSPADNTQFHKTRLNLPVGLEPSISLVGSSGNVTGYRIISIPYELSNNGINENFEELGGADPKKFRFIRYHELPSPGWDLYPGSLNTLNIGDGYFINVRNTITIALKEAKVPDFSQGSLFSMNLKKGWNQIGNPYTTQIVWTDVLAYNANPAGVSNVSKFNGQYFIDPAGAIDPFEGGFVQAENDITIQIPFKGFTSGGKKRNVITNSQIDKPSWVASVTLKQSDLTYGLGSVGMNPDASAGKDIFDLITPPRLSEFTEINFDHPEHFMQRFTRDIVPTADEHVWKFTVDTNITGRAELSWGASTFGDGNKDLFLFDATLQKPINMREVASYSFNPHETSVFRIHFGENLKDKIKPDVVLLGDPYPNPTAGTSMIPFTLPELDGNFNVRLEVYDMMGRKVETLRNEELPTGFYSSRWEGDKNNGLYTYRLFVEANGKKQVHTKKILVNK